MYAQFEKMFFKRRLNDWYIRLGSAWTVTGGTRGLWASGSTCTGCPSVCSTVISQLTINLIRYLVQPDQINLAVFFLVLLNQVTCAMYTTIHASTIQVFFKKVPETYGRLKLVLGYFRKNILIQLGNLGFKQEGIRIGTKTLFLDLKLFLNEYAKIVKGKPQKNLFFLSWQSTKRKGWG